MEMYLVLPSFLFPCHLFRSARHRFNESDVILIESDLILKGHLELIGFDVITCLPSFTGFPLPVSVRKQREPENCRQPCGPFYRVFYRVLFLCACVCAAPVAAFVPKDRRRLGRRPSCGVATPCDVVNGEPSDQSQRGSFPFSKPPPSSDNFR